MPAHPLRWIFSAIVKPMALTDPLYSKTAKLSLVAVCVALLLFTSFLSFFTIYAQQGGNATGGAAQGGAAGGAAPCYGSNCNYYYYGGPATGGQATGGAAIGQEGTDGLSQKPSEVKSKSTIDPPIAIPNTSQTTVNDNTTTVTVIGKQNVSDIPSVLSSQDISLSVDKPAYVAGETVKLKGKVKEVTEGDVRLDIYGPNGNPDNTLYADPVNNGDFSQSIGTLSSDSKGQYTIEAIYNGQTGSGQFNLKSEYSGMNNSSSSQDISLSVDKPAYVAGETVKLKGKVKEVTEGDVRLDIYGPNGNPDNTLYADPVNNGDFSQSIGTLSSDSKGQYTIEAIYNGQTGSGQFNLKSEYSGMNNSSSSQDISLSVDKPAYVAGETVKLKGKVKEVTEGDVRLDIYGPNGNPDNTLYADPVNNGDFSQSIGTLSSDSKGQYTIEAIYNGQTGSGQFNLKSEYSGMNNSSSSQDISLSVDKPAYVAGETVKLKGKVKEVTEGDVRLDIYGPNGNPDNTLYADPVNNGDFSQSIGTLSSDSKGQYTIEAIYNGQTGSGQFNLK